jgi:phosphonate degradation associated HDIG domain protein
MTTASVEDVLALYDRWGGHRYDEALTQHDHAVQTAALAAAAGGSDALVVAALLHDVGHLLDLEANDGRPGASTDLAHEARGARYLAGLFPPEVTGPIALHVTAKRYRCTVDPGYRDTLSAGSTRSLALQGGRMTVEEVARFEHHPGFEDAVRLRGWDDDAKVDGLEVAPLGSYRDMLQRVCTSR